MPLLTVNPAKHTRIARNGRYYHAKRVNFFSEWPCALMLNSEQVTGSALAAGRPPGGPPEAMVCARRNDANKFLLFDAGSRNHFTKKSNLSKFYEKT